MASRALAVLLICLLPPWAFSANLKIKVHWAIFDMSAEPFQYNNEGTPKGPDLDIIREVFRRLPKYQLSEHILPISRGAQSYRRGNIDMILLANYKDSHHHSVITKNPLRWLQIKLAVLADSKLEYSQISDLTGKHIGMLPGLSLESPLKQAIETKQVQVTRLKDAPNLLEMLYRRRLDAVLGTEPGMLRMAKKLNINIRVLKETPEKYRGYYPAISVNSAIENKAQLLADIGRTITAMQADGSYDEIYAKYDIKKHEYRLSAPES